MDKTDGLIYGPWTPTTLHGIDIHFQQQSVTIPACGPMHYDFSGGTNYRCSRCGWTTTQPPHHDTGLHNRLIFHFQFCPLKNSPDQF